MRPPAPAAPRAPRPERPPAPRHRHTPPARMPPRPEHPAARAAKHPGQQPRLDTSGRTSYRHHQVPPPAPPGGLPRSHCQEITGRAAAITDMATVTPSINPRIANPPNHSATTPSVTQALSQWTPSTARDNGQLLRYRNGRRITYRRYDHLWTRLGRHLPWVRTQQVSSHWIRHTTLTWVEGRGVASDATFRRRREEALAGAAVLPGGRRAGGRAAGHAVDQGLLAPGCAG